MKANAKKGKRFSRRQKHAKKRRRRTEAERRRAEVTRILTDAAVEQAESTAAEARRMIAERKAEYRHVYPWPHVPAAETIADRFKEAFGTRAAMVRLTPKPVGKALFSFVLEQLFEDDEYWSGQVGYDSLVGSQHVIKRGDGLDVSAVGFEAVLLVLVDDAKNQAFAEYEAPNYEWMVKSHAYLYGRQLMGDMGYAWDNDPLFVLTVAGAS
jgi:hypothetical protein